MSKSNNNLYTPDSIGKQKGEHSPFFHTPSSKELQTILLNLQEHPSFSDHSSTLELSTFFHEPTREHFLKEAQNCAEERVDLAHRIAASTMELAKQMYRLSSIISPPLEKENDPLSACASRTRKASEVLSHIDTNILFSMNKTMVSEMNNDIFFQIEKKLFFVELAEKHQEKSPQNSDERKRSLLCYPP